jgi:hypothetical protein
MINRVPRVARRRHRRRTLVAASVLVAALRLEVGIAHAEAPRPDHAAECNREARERSGASASPNRKDQVSAADAREARPDSHERVDSTGQTTRSPDAQIDGMNAEGAKDPGYRAIYRVCMRKKGF